MTIRVPHIIACVAIIMLSAARLSAAETATNTTDEVEVTLQNLRDPFWPVGYKPLPKSVKQESERVTRIQRQTRWPELELRGITRRGQAEFIAVIEGVGLVESGDIISMRKEGLIYRWRINAISENGISRTRLDVREPTSALQQPE